MLRHAEVPRHTFVFFPLNITHLHEICCFPPLSQSRGDSHMRVRGREGAKTGASRVRCKTLVTAQTVLFTTIAR